MKKSTEKASVPVRIYKSTHRNLKIRAAIANKTMADLIEQLSACACGAPWGHTGKHWTTKH